MPEEIARYLAADGPGQSFDLNEFYERVAEREQTGLSPAQAREHAMAVMSTVVNAVTPRQVNHLAAQYQSCCADGIQRARQRDPGTLRSHLGSGAARW